MKEYKVKQVTSRSELIGYTCKVEGSEYMGFGKDIQSAIKHQISNTEYYSKRPRIKELLSRCV